MANEVIKKDGTKEPFDSEKIRGAIRAAAQRSDLSEERIDEVVNQVSEVAIQLVREREEISTSEIREKILAELDTVEPSISIAWREYDKQKEQSQEV